MTSNIIVKFLLSEYRLKSIDFSYNFKENGNNKKRKVNIANI